MSWMNAAERFLAPNIAVFVASGAIVWFAGVQLARCADAIAEKTGIGREFLGILLLGGVTSLPELAVAVTATLQGTPALTVNDVLGSAAINVVIIAIADAVVGRDAITSMLGSPGVMLQGVLGMVVMALTLGATLAGDVLVLGVGAWCWVMLAVYLGSIRLLSKSNVNIAWTPSVSRHAYAGLPSNGNVQQSSLRRLVWTTIAAGSAILVAGYLLARTGAVIAGQTGLGTSFFGAVFLAFTTSLPELSTVIGAVRLRRYEMAISDVFGTNLFNVTIIVLVDALHPGGPVLLSAGRTASFGALMALVLTAIYLVGLLERRNRAFMRMGFDSIAVLMAYAAGVVVLYGLR